MRISIQIVYKYLKFVVFSNDDTQKKSQSEVKKHCEDTLEFLNNDRLHLVLLEKYTID